MRRSCAFIRVDGKSCWFAPEWSVHEEGRHPSETFEACELHLAELLERGKRYTIFPALSDLPEPRAVGP